MDRFNTILNELNIDTTNAFEIEKLNIQVFYQLKNKKNGIQILSQLLYNYIYDKGSNELVIQHIIHSGADVNYLYNGKPILFALFNGSTSIDINYVMNIINILLFHNVNINTTNNKGQTILILYICIVDTVVYSMNPNTSIMIDSDIRNHTFINFLLLNGIDVNIRDIYDKSAYDYLNDSITHYTNTKLKNNSITNSNDLIYMNNLADLLISRCNTILNDIKPYCLSDTRESKSNI